MKEKIQHLIAKNRLFEAIKMMTDLPIKRSEKKALAVIESRLNSVNEKIRLGILSEENATIELNKIRNSLLDVFMVFENKSTPPLAPQKYKLVFFASTFLIFVIGGIWMWSTSEELDCKDSKVAIMVADFQNLENAQATDGFANSLVTNLSSSLHSNLYDVSQVDKQSRKVKRYDEFICEEYFEFACDTSGLFVNGFLSLKDSIFNVYITLANLEMNALGNHTKPIAFDNPSGIDFSIRNNSKFLGEMLYAIIKTYEGEPYEALESFFELEKNDTKGFIKNDKKLKATIAYFKGNSYAMRGDNKRAKKQYEIVEQNGNSELVTSARYNSETADKVNKEMREDPEMNVLLAENNREHSKFEQELNNFFKGLERGISRGAKKIFRNM